MKWEEGRQGTGYFKLKLFESEKFKFDCYLIKFPKGSKITTHNDPAPKGYEHHRLNVILKKAKEGGLFCCQKMQIGRCDYFPYYERIIKFRPDINQHYVTKILKGTRWVFSVGWLKEKKDGRN